MSTKHENRVAWLALQISEAHAQRDEAAIELHDDVDPVREITLLSTISYLNDRLQMLTTMQTNEEHIALEERIARRTREGATS